MTKWKLNVLFNSGKELECYYKGPETFGRDVADKLVEWGGNNRIFVSVENIDSTENIFFCLQEVAAISISIA